ncbi:MAG: hypothetical protein D6737_09815, partial [Chloroflexi bacterium]
DYLQRLIDDGTAVLFGRTQNTDYTSMGIIIMQAKSEAEARAIIEQDPAVQNRIFRAELYPYRIALFRA